MLYSILDSAVLVAVVAGAFRLLRVWYENHRDLRRARQHYKGMNESVELSDEIQILRTRLHFHRIVVAKVHNGGDILHPASAKYVSALEDSFSNEITTSIRKDYQNVVLDNQYKEVLHRTMTSKYYHLQTYMMGKDGSDDKLKDENGILYTVYKANEIKSIFFIYLGANRHGLIWMSLQSRGAREDFDARQKQILKITIPSLREKLHISEPPKYSL